MADPAQQIPPARVSGAAIAARLDAVRARIRSALDDARSGERPSVAAATVTLVAVSKGHEGAAIEAAIDRGQRVFGENRVQEAVAKWAPLRERHSDIELHLIGPLQTNKVADAVRLFDVIETVDRDKLADALAKEMRATGRMLPCFVQVNTGEEPQKSGVLPGDADAFIARAREAHGLNIVGAMCIPPVDDDPGAHFALLYAIARRNGLACLSMGMSNDFERAVAYGATHVRIGTAIFGPRPSRVQEE
jgi:pyridoxal phosphate enzyme (YggS family)